MTFSKEDKAAWLNSEVMKEFETLIKNGEFAELDSEFEKAYLPLEQKPEKEEESWEEEEELENKLEEALEEFETVDDSYEKDFVDCRDTLIENIAGLAQDLIKNKNIKAAHKVERAVLGLKALFQED